MNRYRIVRRPHHPSGDASFDDSLRPWVVEQWDPDPRFPISPWRSVAACPTWGNAMSDVRLMLHIDAYTAVSA